MLSYIDDQSKHKLNLGSEVEGSTEFDLMVHQVEVTCENFDFQSGSVKSIFFRFLNCELPYRKESNGSMLITLDEIAGFVFRETAMISCKVSFNAANEGAIFLYGNYSSKCWTLHGITNGYA
ncbi:hypothetical protein M3589_24005 [Heyndrickxia oleronia]|uniref:Uncharacterized protein n=1 Tax=Heyndrickxia oleronia TaxID=38875 RepID=A0AAW6SWT5_9BACI|nr:hypothetical protein [Heyndrickxia oleronia]MCM3240723.1 hypothetical protein [Heyndrickxia oleronia]MDH5163329.1 hypothetical protein [Heyndrickxia oleronia]